MITSVPTRRELVTPEDGTSDSEARRLSTKVRRSHPCAALSRTSRWYLVAVYAKKRKHLSHAAAGRWFCVIMYRSGADVQSTWHSVSPGNGSGSAKKSLKAVCGSRQCVVSRAWGLSSRSHLIRVRCGSSARSKRYRRDESTGIG